MLRLRCAPAVLACLALIACHAPVAPPNGSASPDGDAHQIHWQRSLDDALALAKAEGLPLLLAVNMDGESASDRIVHEEYRDPAFVAATRHYVCVAASVFRHNVRDYDDQGNRIPCPRLGCCTCGEHMAMEPRLFEKLLADGERVAPRHAVILPDGKKAWDLSLCFDLKDIDRAVEGSAAAGVQAAPLATTDWAALAAQRSHRGRVLFERAVAAAGEAQLAAALDAIAAHGDPGSIDALRLLVPRLPNQSATLQAKFVATVKARSLEVAIATALRDQMLCVRPEVPAVPGVPEQQGPPADSWLPMLAAVDGGRDATRTLLLACRVLQEYRAGAAVATAFGGGAATAIAKAIDAHGGAMPFGAASRAAAVTEREAAGAPPKPGPYTDAMPTEDELSKELDTLDAQLQANHDDVALRARYAKASLDLARRHIETQQKDVAVLLADAELNFERVLKVQPDNIDWWVERARTAYFDGRFADEAAHGRATLRAVLGRDVEQLPVEQPLRDPAAVEAMRWIADGDARRYTSLLASDPAGAAGLLLEAMRAFAFVATSVCGDEGDWTTFASFCGSLGLWREQFDAARLGALRLPAGRALRQTLNEALWQLGGAGSVVAVADGITQHLRVDDPARADAQWFAGYACMLEAENARRTEQMDVAVQSYAKARERFASAAELRADYADNCHYWNALAWVGNGLADARAGRREAAADDLVAAVRSSPKLALASDGLGYDVLDLTDKIGEWRAEGPSSVDVMKLLDRLDAIAPADPFYAVALADSQLREALRADGRNPVRAMSDTVDASGNKIRMLMGLPNDEGDHYLHTSIELLRRTKSRLVSDDDKKALAQSDTIWAERMLQRDRLDGVAEALAEAATMLGQTPPAADADIAALRVSAAALRMLLGDARPRWRMGR